MNRIVLNGEWELTGDQFTDVEGLVPGCVHTDLLSKGLIEDPYYRDNEERLMYIGKTDWLYRRVFKVTKESLNKEVVELVCLGLDTFADIVINGREVATTDNMFRQYRFDVKSFLYEGLNTIEINFRSTYPHMEEKVKERYLEITGRDHHRVTGNNYVRKMQCNYGWDWGPMCVTAGIWQDIYIESYDSARIEDVQLIQSHQDGQVTVEAKVNLSDIGQDISVVCEMSFEEELVDVQTCHLSGKCGSASIIVVNPKLWWPNNLGDQLLYDITVKVLNKKGKTLDINTQRIGLRTINLDRHPDVYGESFQFVVNDVPFFAKGANWIPIDTFVTRGTDTFYRELLVAAKEANMNMIRVWGGGLYEKDIFYDICDELGLCVWQDFAFACSAYPVYDEQFVKTFKEEAKDNVIRLRNHPSLALWCGNNEIEAMGNMVSKDGAYGSMSFEEYKYLFDHLIPSVLEDYDGCHDYWPSSPMDDAGNRVNPNDPTRGDAHLWDVWHGRKPFEWYRTCTHRFNSEFGFQSFPEPNVINSFTEESDRNITSYVMEKHQRSPIGNDAILQYMLSWFKLPTSFDMLMWTSQILQGLAIKYAVEHWRRSMPRGMGTLYWQLNDCWPVASWSSIDYTGNYKALHYKAKNFFSPVLISGVEDKDNIRLELHLSNDLREDQSGQVSYIVYGLDGHKVEENEFHMDIEAGQSKEVIKLDLKAVIEDNGGIRNCVVWYGYKVAGEILTDNTTFFERPKHLKLEAASINKSIKQIDETHFTITLTTNKPTFWLWTSIGEQYGRYSDRFFDLYPHQSKVIQMTTDKEMTLEAFGDLLTINSITDTYK